MLALKSANRLRSGISIQDIQKENGNITAILTLKGNRGNKFDIDATRQSLKNLINQCDWGNAKIQVSCERIQKKNRKGLGNPNSKKEEERRKREERERIKVTFSNGNAKKIMATIDGQCFMTQIGLLEIFSGKERGSSSLVFYGSVILVGLILYYGFPGIIALISKQEQEQAVKELQAKNPNVVIDTHFRNSPYYRKLLSQYIPGSENIDRRLINAVEERIVQMTDLRRKGKYDKADALMLFAETLPTTKNGIATVGRSIKIVDTSKVRSLINEKGHLSPKTVIITVAGKDYCYSQYGANLNKKN